MKSPNALMIALKGGAVSIVQLWLCGLLLVGLRLVMPTQVGNLTEAFQSKAQSEITASSLYYSIGLIFASQLFIAIITFVQESTRLKVQARLVRSVAMDLYTRVVRFAPFYFQEHSVEAINARVLEDSRALVDFCVRGFVLVPLALVSLVVFGGYMILTNWLLGLCMIPLSLLSGYFLVFDRRIQDLSRRSHLVWDEIRVRTNEVIGGVSELRVNDAFDYGLGSLERPFGQYKDLMRHIGRWSAFFESSGPLMTTIQTSVLYWIGAYLCLGDSRLEAIAGRMTWGEVIEFMLVVALFAQPVNVLSTFVLGWRMSRDSLKRVAELYDRPEEFPRDQDNSESSGRFPDDAPGTGSGALEYAEVDVVSHDGVEILRSISAVFEEGAHTGIVGRAGCGKSTLLQLAIRGVAPSHGRVTLAGKEIRDFSMSELARILGFVSQKTTLFDASIRNNVLLGLRRPSRVILDDDSGPIDISVLPAVNDRRSLDKEIASVFQKVGLYDDVFKKGLDGRLPEGATFASLRSRIVELRIAVRQANKQLDSEYLVLFRKDRFLTEGTIGENLFGPGVTFDGKYQANVDRVYPYLLRFELLEELVRRVPFERSSAVSPSDSNLRQFGNTVRNAIACEQETFINLILSVDGDGVSTREDPSRLRQRVLSARESLEEMADYRLGQPAWPVLQDDYIERLTLRENLLLGRVNRHAYRSFERVDLIISRVMESQGCLDDILTAGLEYRVGEGGKFLSGGQQQLLSLARAILKRPKMLLLDEATSNLDELSQAKISDLIRQEFSGKSLVAISHRLAMLRNFDHIVVMDAGRIVRQGRFEALEQSEGLLHELVSCENEGFSPGVHALKELTPHFGISEPQAIPIAIRHRMSILSRCALFSRLDSGQLAKVANAFRASECSKGTILFRRGEPGSDLLVILKGEIEVFHSENPDLSDRGVVKTYGPDHTFGERSIFYETARQVSAQAKSDLRFLVLHRDDLMTLIKSEPMIAIKFLQEIACDSESLNSSDERS